MDEILTEVTEMIDVPEIQEVEAIDTVDSVDQVENELDVPKTQQPQLGTVVTNAVIGSLVGYGMSIVLPAVGRAVCKGFKGISNKIAQSKEKKAKASKIEEEVADVNVNLEEIEVEVELDAEN